MAFCEDEAIRQILNDRLAPEHLIQIRDQLMVHYRNLWRRKLDIWRRKANLWRSLSDSGYNSDENSILDDEENFEEFQPGRAQEENAYPEQNHPVNANNQNVDEGGAGGSGRSGRPH